jgi:multimeric flavodoxin WrbA
MPINLLYYLENGKRCIRLQEKEKDMNVLMINGSPRGQGNTSIALKEMEKIFGQEGIDTETIHVGNKDIRGCIACGSCMEKGRCVFDDLVNETAPKFEACDGLVVGSPVYYASANATLVAFLDRLFYSTRFDKTMKVGASVVAARRGGLSSTFDELNKFFTICGMPVASGQYWNSIHGRTPGEALEDAEGLQSMRTLARNMAFLMKSIALGKEAYGLPEKEPAVRTNFVR